mmetsp:Transcript_27634/g.58035  ORF Transcript_27634/g.58035 Transcript_27634/m.58035 type:complete len:491 (+) Transcript_27634:105-1577(+)
MKIQPRAQLRSRSNFRHLKLCLAGPIIIVALCQLMLVRYHSHKQHIIDSDRTRFYQPSGSSLEHRNHDGRSHPFEYIMWSKEESYTKDCTNNFKGNETWGRLHSPFVDKIRAKEILIKENIPNLNVIPTFAVLDKDNISLVTLDFMKSIPQPYIIKATHVSGGVARVYNNTYSCFKYCGDKIPLSPIPLDEAAARYAYAQINEDINLDYSSLGGELQYKYITPHIIFEEDIISGGKTNTDVTFWWLSGGIPLFISQQCGKPLEGEHGFQKERIFVDTQFRRTPIMFNRPTCTDMVEKPKSWEKQLEVMKRLGKLFPREVIRIDVYGGGDEVWFSEFTFTTAGCWRTFQPIVTDGVLYAVQYNKIPREVINADFIQKVLRDDSWVSVSLDNNGSHLTEYTGVHPSPVDLCSRLQEYADKAMKETLFQSCIEEAKRLSSFPLRCIVTHNNRLVYHSFGLVANELDRVSANDNVVVCLEGYRRMQGQFIIIDG